MGFDRFVNLKHHYVTLAFLNLICETYVVSMYNISFFSSSFKIWMNEDTKNVKFPWTVNSSTFWYIQGNVEFLLARKLQIPYEQTYIDF